MPSLATFGGLSARGFGFGAAATGLKIQNVFDIDLWTGTGSAQSITTPFAPDMVWIKSRSNATDHALFDVAQGVGKYFSSNTIVGQSTDATTLTAFNAGGYSLGTDTAALVNTSARTYVGWAPKKAPGFFDVVTWTGNATNRAIAHNLGSVPGMIIVEGLGGSSAFIGVYHRSLPNTQYLWLSQTSGAATSGTYWNSTTADATSFYLGTGSVVNGSGQAYVAYLFGSDNSASGLVYCDTFTADSSGNATVSSLGWEPQWLLYKGTSGAGTGWAILDTTRGWGTAAMNRLVPNSSGAEGALGANLARPTSNGFVFENSALTPDEPYVYMTIRKGPM